MILYNYQNVYKTFVEKIQTVVFKFTELAYEDESSEYENTDNLNLSNFCSLERNGLLAVR